MTSRCELHPAYESDYCPVCGTTVPISDRTPATVSPLDLNPGDAVTVTHPTGITEPATVLGVIRDPDFPAVYVMYADRTNSRLDNGATVTRTTKGTPMTVTTDNEYADALVSELHKLDVPAEIIATGGNCEAVAIDYAGGELLVTDGDAALPSVAYGALVLDYPAAMDGDAIDTGIVAAGVDEPGYDGQTSPADVARSIVAYLSAKV
jgi:hypothetical protein